ncbi:MAG: biotin transporter BioY [Leptolyngbya sp. SIO1E4]|nr:biotin transporter BioY [Leptolyngbya sp. SIO1E4]
MFSPLDLLWALMGLILTITATWLDAFIINAPWNWSTTGVQISLGVSFQVGAVLLTACMGGKNAAALAQIAYVILGLLLFQFFGFSIFTQGGGLGYVREPSFGYLLGFIPAAWVCGYLAFQERPKLETLAYSSLCGLGIIHGCGLLYLAIASLGGWLEQVSAPAWEEILAYSLAPLPGQLIMVCAVSVLAYLLRQFLFY